VTLGVTAAVCTRNRPGQLRRALRSLVAQELVPGEILVVDNSPADDATRRLVASEFPRIRYVREPVPGLDVARNRALTAATMDIVAFLDDDAVADPYWIATLSSAFADNPDAAACTGRVDPLALDTEAQRLFEANGGMTGSQVTRRLRLPRDAGLLMGGRPAPRVAWALTAGCGCNLAVHRQRALALGGFDEALGAGSMAPGGEEGDLLWRMLAAGLPVICEPGARVAHEHRETMDALAHQLAGYQAGIVALLTKTLGRTRGQERLGVFAFLVWRLAKPLVRLLRRTMGRDPLPASMLLRMWWSGWCGLRAYRTGVRVAANRRRTPPT